MCCSALAFIVPGILINSAMCTFQQRNVYPRFPNSSISCLHWFPIDTNAWSQNVTFVLVGKLELKRIGNNNGDLRLETLYAHGLMSWYINTNPFPALYAIARICVACGEYDQALIGFTTNGIRLYWEIVPALLAMANRNCNLLFPINQTHESDIIPSCYVRAVFIY